VRRAGEKALDCLTGVDVRTVRSQSAVSSVAVPDTDAYLERLAELAVAFGANVQPGQIVGVQSAIGKEELTRAIAAAAYRHGAKFVDAVYFDPYVKRARIEHASGETLDFVPSWYGERALSLGVERAARIGLSGPGDPSIFDGLDPERLGRDRLPWLKETGLLVNQRTTNWTAVPGPTREWACLVHPDLDPDQAYERLWQEIGHVCRLDEPDPVAAWTARLDVLLENAAKLSALRLDAVHLEGPGTDLTIGLLPGSRWHAANFLTVDDLEHHPNLPTEEVFTTPDPKRADGHVAATKPLELGGTVVRGLRVRFEGGKAVEIDADEGAEILRGRTASDEGGSRLGEVALVDREGRIGPLGTVFYDTLLDENAASHVALGRGFEFVVDPADHSRINQSEIHIDFMIGSNDLSVTGIATSGERVPLLRDGNWQI
jgi:aminopeptidase